MMGSAVRCAFDHKHTYEYKTSTVLSFVIDVEWVCQLAERYMYDPDWRSDKTLDLNTKRLRFETRVVKNW